MSFREVGMKILYSLAATLLGSSMLFGQDPRGMILGRVTDPSGAVIPGVAVNVVNVATGVSAAGRTNESGNFILPYLLPGTYTFSAELTGFKRFVREGIQVRVRDSVEVNVQMQVGDVAESVQVTAETPLLSTTESSLGQVVDTRRVLELPLFAGNAMDLVHLAPGTVNATDLRLRKAPFTAAPSQFSTDGSGTASSEFSIDGISNTSSTRGWVQVAFPPPAASIQEFKIQTSSFDASIGHTIGSVVNVSTKSGTNELHGEMHWWLRHSKLDCPTIFQNRAGLKKLPVYRDNRYGASAGAPVYLPGVYKGKSRTFWFFAWEANKFGDPNVGGSMTSTVPRAAWRNGDLSDLLKLGANYQVYDPATIAVAPAGRYSRQPFGGNIIPASRLDPVGQKILALYPLPNMPGTSDGRNNFFMSLPAKEDYWTTIGRFDHAFSESNRMFIRFHRDFWEEDKNRSFGNDVNGIILNRINRGIALDDVHMFGPGFVLNFRYGLTQQDFPERRVSRGFDLASLGFSQNLVNLVDKRLATVPRTSVGSLTTLSTWESGDGITTSMTHSFTLNFTRLVGSHNIRFGSENRVYRENRNRFQFDVSPDFSFGNYYTRGPLDNSPAPPVGGELAALLLGIPGGSMSRTASYAEQDKYFALYLHDDFKVSSKLTLNLGLRYELESPITERHDRAVAGFAFGQPNPIEAQARANYAKGPIPELPASEFRVLGGLTFVSTGGNPRTYWKGEKNNLLPRFGFAYQLLPKTILRGGYGWFLDSIGVNKTDSVQIGFSQSTPIQPSLDNGLTFIASTANPFPKGLDQPLGAAGGLETNLGQSVSFFGVRRKHPYMQKWSFGVQRQLPQEVVAEASYVGTRGTRLVVNRELNFTPAKYLSTLPYRDQPTINSLTATFPNPFFGIKPIYGTTISRAGVLNAYPHFSSVVQVGEPIGYSWYHSLQIRAEKRFSKGYTFTLAYAWSKAMAATAFLNSSDPTPYESIADVDRTHRLVLSGIYELPFGRGRQLGSTWHPALNFIAGGWQLNAFVQRQSGAPLGFGNIIFNGNPDDIRLPKNQRSVDRWFNIDAGFNRNSAQQLSNNIRTFPLWFSGIRSDGQARWDFSAIKNFQITERAKMQFRAETFNAWNHPNLGSPNTSPTSTAFGTITSQNPPRSWQMALALTI